MNEKLPLDLFTSVLSAIKISHWTATKHSAHKVLDELHDDLQGNFDKFVESYIGLLKDEYTTSGIELGFDEDDEMIIRTTDIVKILKSFLIKLKPFAEKGSELMSIYDDIKNDINKAIYLLNMCY